MLIRDGTSELNHWRAPAPLRRLYPRYGITESETDESTAVKV
jgi:hypothetical protein